MDPDDLSPSSITQALHVINGDTINRKLRAKGGIIQRLLDEKLDNAAAVERLYLAALSRAPTAGELRALAQAMDGAGAGEERRLVLEDLAWAVLTGKEFLFNH